MSEGHNPPDVLALTVDEAVEVLEKTGWSVAEIKAARPPGGETPPQEQGRVARVRLVAERTVEIVYVAVPELGEKTKQEKGAEQADKA